MRIRPATHSDLTDLLNLYHHLHPDDAPPPPRDQLLATFNTILADPHHHLLVGELHNQLITSCTLILIPTSPAAHAPTASSKTSSPTPTTAAAATPPPSSSTPSNSPGETAPTKSCSSPVPKTPPPTASTKTQASNPTSKPASSPSLLTTTSNERDHQQAHLPPYSPVVLFATDVTCTLLGQPSDYWAGQYDLNLEANAIARYLLALSPFAFLAAAAVYALLFCYVIHRLPTFLAWWLSFALVFAHFGGARS